MQAVVRKIVGNKAQGRKIATAYEGNRQISAASKKINIPKNIQNKMFIKASISSDKVQQQKDKMYAPP